MTPITRNDSFLKVSEAAALARCHPETLYRWFRRGELPLYGRPGTLRVRLSDILKRVDKIARNRGKEAE